MGAREQVKGWLARFFPVPSSPGGPGARVAKQRSSAQSALEGQELMSGDSDE